MLTFVLACSAISAVMAVWMVMLGRLMESVPFDDSSILPDLFTDHPFVMGLIIFMGMLAFLLCVAPDLLKAPWDASPSIHYEVREE